MRLSRRESHWTPRQPHCPHSQCHRLMAPPRLNRSRISLRTAPTSRTSKRDGTRAPLSPPSSPGLSIRPLRGSEPRHTLYPCHSLIAAVCRPALAPGTRAHCERRDRYSRARGYPDRPRPGIPPFPVCTSNHTCAPPCALRARRWLPQPSLFEAPLPHKGQWEDAPLWLLRSPAVGCPSASLHRGRRRV